MRGYMIDFKKLNDPEWKEKCRQEREAEAKRLEAIEAEQRAAIELCEKHEDKLSDKERRFISSVRFELARTSVLTTAQDKWLRDIAARFTQG